MIDILDCLPTDEIFSHDDNGVIRYFNATRMFKWSVENPDKVEHFEVEIDRDFINYVITCRGVEPWKIERLCEPYLSLPVIGVVMEDGSTLTVDGHHRLVRHFYDGRTIYNMVRFPLGVWEAFLVDMDPRKVEEWFRRHR
jgi:hypothetical protein